LSHFSTFPPRRLLLLLLLLLLLPLLLLLLLLLHAAAAFTDTAFCSSCGRGIFSCADTLVATKRWVSESRERERERESCSKN
jgi:hypothetical protein